MAVTKAFEIGLLAQGLDVDNSTGEVLTINMDTDVISEGTSNLYFTDERVDDRVASLLVASTNISLTYDDNAGTLTIAVDSTGGLDLTNNDTDDLTEGTANLYYTDARVQTYLSGGTATTIETTGDVIIGGNLTVNGSSSTINSTTLTVDDLNITIASGAADSAAANGAGITVDGANATLTYTASGDKWVFNKEPYYNTNRLLNASDYHFKTVTVSDTNSGYTWSEDGNTSAAAVGDTLKFISGQAIDIDVDTSGKALLVSHADTSSAITLTSTNTGNTFIQSLTVGIDGLGHVTSLSATPTAVVFPDNIGTLSVTDTDSGYTWSATGSATAINNSDTFIFVSGNGLDVDIDTVSRAIRFSKIDENIIKTITVDDTDTEYTWSDEGSYSVASNSDTLTFVSGSGIDVDVDTSNGAIRIEHVDTSNVSDVTATTNTFISAQTYDGFGHVDTVTTASISWNVSDNYAFKTIAVSGQNNIVADSNADTLTVIAGTGVTLTTDDTQDELTITNSDPGSSQDIIKSIVVTDTNTGYTWSETGTYTVSGNTDSLTFVTGDSLDIDIDTTSGAVLITHNVGGANATITATANTFVDEITVDAQGHVTSVATSALDFNVSDNYAFKTISDGTNTAVADSNTDTLSFIGGNQIAITVTDDDATYGDFVSISHSNSGVTNGTYGDSSNYAIVTVDAQGHVTSASSQALPLAFGTVTIDGTTNLVADSTSDTLSISAAQVDSTTGIVLTATVGTDSFTIAHADTSTASNVSVATNTFVDEVVLDTYGHITTIGTGTISWNVSDNYAFKTFTDGTTDAVADSNADTFTFAKTDQIEVTVSATGDSLTIGHADSGVTAAQYGSGTAVPVITIDAQGHITAATTAAINTSWTLTDSSTSQTISGGDTLTVASGTGISAVVSATDTLTITNTSPGSGQDIVKSYVVTDTDSGYTWSQTGTYSVSGNTDTLTFVSGTGIDVDIDTTSGAIRIENLNNYNVFETFTVTDTNSGFTWSETGSATASGGTDTLTFVSGTGIDIDVDPTNQAILFRITNDSAFTSYTFTGTGSATTFSTGSTSIIDVQVYVNGVSLMPSDYSFDTATGDLDFVVAPLNGDDILVYAYTSQPGSFTLSSLQLDNHNFIAVDGSGNVTINGNLTVSGTQSSGSSQTLSDPIITLGGSTPPTSDDNFDRGVVFRWHDGSSAHVGFFGFDDTDSSFHFIPSTGGTNPYTGDLGNGKFAGVYAGNVQVGITGDNEIDTSTGNLTIDSAGGTTTIDDILSVSGAATFSSTVGVTSTLTASGGFAVAASQTVDFNGNRLQDIGTPTATTDAATKGYVDTLVTAQDLDITTGSGTIAIDLDSETLTISGTTNEIETSATGNTVTIGLPNDVTIGNNLSVTGNATVTGNLTANGNITLGNAVTDTITINATIQGANPLVFEGGTADGFETTFAITNPTQDRTITFKDATGTVAFVADIPTNNNQLTNGSNYITLGSLSVGAEATASGDGGIAYNNSTGVFTYTPPDLSSYLTAESDTLNSVVVRGATTTNAITTGAHTISEANTPGHLYLKRTDTTPNDNDILGTVSFLGPSDTTASRSYGYIQVTSTDVTDATHTGNIEFWTTTNAISAQRMEIGNTIILNANLEMGSNSIIFEGSTNDAFETTVTVVDPTADRTITLPNATGTVAVNASTGSTTQGTWNGSISAAGTISGTAYGLSTTDNVTFNNVTANGNVTLGSDSTDTVTINGVIQGASPLVFEGSTADGFETTFAITNPTADRTITFPNATGTVAVSAASGSTTQGTWNGSISAAGQISGTVYGLTTTDNVTFNNLTANGNVTLGSDATDTITMNGVLQLTSALVFEGSSADANETTLSITNPTADRTITLPDASGTVAVAVSDTTGQTGINLTLSAAGAISGVVSGLTTTSEVEFADVRVDSTLYDGTSSVVNFTNTTAGFLIDSYSSVLYRSAKYVVQITGTSEYQVTELLVIHDGTNAYLTSYGTMYTGSAPILTGFDASIVGNEVRITAIGAYTGNKTIKIQRNLIDV